MTLLEVHQLFPSTLAIFPLRSTLAAIAVQIWWPSPTLAIELDQPPRHQLKTPGAELHIYTTWQVANIWLCCILWSSTFLLGADSRGWTGHFPGCVFVQTVFKSHCWQWRIWMDLIWRKWEMCITVGREPMNCTLLIHWNWSHNIWQKKPATKSAHLGSLVPLPQLAKDLDATVWKTLIGRTAQAAGSEEIVKGAFLSENVLEAHSTWKRKNTMNESLSWNWLSREAVSRKIRDSQMCGTCKAATSWSVSCRIGSRPPAKRRTCNLPAWKKRNGHDTNFSQSLTEHKLLLKYLI